MPDNTIDIKGGNNQILPNAEKTVQNIYYGDSAIKLALQHSEEPIENSTEDKNNTSDALSNSVEHELLRHDQTFETAAPETAMKIAILHLSDLHINSDNASWINDRAHQVANAVKMACADSAKIYVVVSGDIANTAMPEEYEQAATFFARLKSGLTSNYNGKIPVETRILCVPGNHDVYLKEDNKLRSVLLKHVSENYPAIDNSIFDAIVTTQSNYSDFVRKVNGDDNYKPLLLSTFDDKVSNYHLHFNLYNTAWMSGKKDQQGTIFMPLETGAKTPKDTNLVISVMHHYYNWLSVDKQNKTNFMRRLGGSSNILLYGHEHEIIATGKTDNLSIGLISEYEGAAFYSKDKTTGEVQSQFQVLVIDTQQSTCQQTVYGYRPKDAIYGQIFAQALSISSERKTDAFRNNTEFFQNLDEMPTPIYNHEKEKLKLSEIFIYPDLESMNDRINKTDIDGKYLSAEKLLLDAEHTLFILDGGNQCGKTSLLHMYYKTLAGAHKYPLMLSGKDVNNANLRRILRNAYERQYLPEFADYDKFEQYDKTDKILLLDNFDKCRLTRDVKEKMIKNLLLQFGKVIITVSADKFIVDSLNYFSKEATVLYHIKSFGYEKRAKLIEKFFERYDDQNISQQEMLDKTNEALRTVQQFLGKEYIPPYPIYILSLLLSSTKMMGQSYAQTAYGHCYDAIITCALLTQVKDDEVSQFRNFLKNFAFFKFIRKMESTSEEEFREFYDEYQKHYIITSYENCKRVLINTGLLVCEDECYYKFGYKYVYYFTVAEYISGIVNKPEGKQIIQNLCNEIESAEVANILIFLTYHIDDVSFIDETVFTLMSSIEEVAPITLRKDDVFYASIERLCDEMKKEAVDVFKKSDPKKVREELLRQQDTVERERENREEEERQNERHKKMDKAMRAIEVVGQIIKNRRNSLEKSKLLEMVVELYNAGFRTVNFLGSTLAEDKKTFIEDIIKDKDLGGDTVKIREHINYFFELTTFRLCLFVFSKIINSVGVKGLRWLYNDASTQIDTPAADIVTFSIESVYSTLAVEDLKKLVTKYKDNSAAMTIIRARVRSYLYNNFVEINDRKRIASALKLDQNDNQIASNNKQINKYRR